MRKIPPPSIKQVGFNERRSAHEPVPWLWPALWPVLRKIGLMLVLGFGLFGAKTVQASYSSYDCKPCFGYHDPYYSCISMGQMAPQLSVTGFDTKNAGNLVPRKHDTLDLYAENVQAYWYVVLPSSVSQIRFRASGKLTRNDYLRIDGSSSSWLYNNNENSFTNIWSPKLSTKNGSLSGTYVFTSFLSWPYDNYHTGEGFNVDKVQMVCNASTAAPTAAQTFAAPRGQPLHGWLNASGDVAYFKVEQPANQKLLFHLEALSGSNDFDMFGSTNPSPDWSNAMFWPDYNGSTETWTVPAASTNRTIYFAVYSYYGTGQFVATVSRVNTNLGAAKVLVEQDLSSSSNTWVKMRNIMELAADNLANATDGQLFFNSIKTIDKSVWSWLNTDSCHLFRPNCDVVFLNSDIFNFGNPSPPAHTVMHQYIEISHYYWTQNSEDRVGRTIQHEYGHYKFHLGDERCTVNDETHVMCGHTVMIGSHTSDDMDIHDFCVDSNHGTDYCSQCGSSPYADSNWKTLAWWMDNAKTDIPTNYPDYTQYDYQLVDKFIIPFSKKNY